MATTNVDILYGMGQQIEEHMYLDYKRKAPIFSKVFHMHTTRSRYVDMQMWQLYGMPRFRVHGERIKMDAVYPSFGKRYIMRSFGLGDSVPVEDMRDDPFGLFNRVLPGKGGAMASSHRTLMERETAGFFVNQGFASGTSVAGMSDGRSLFNTAHPLSAYNSTTAANRATTDVDLSYSSAQTAETNIRNQLAPNGYEYIDNEPAILMVHPTLAFVAQQIYAQDRQWGGGPNDKNYLKRLQIIVNPYLQISGTNTTNQYWIVIGEQHSLHFFMRQNYEVDTDKDVNTNSVIFTTTSRFDYGATDWRGTYGSKGS